MGDGSLDCRNGPLDAGDEAAADGARRACQSSQP
jgi:hypothetical protein